MQGGLNVHCERVRSTEHAPRDPFSVLERRHGLAEIVERGAVGFVKQHTLSPTSNERIHLPTLVAAGGAAFVVIAALALAATDPKAENVVLDMFAGV